jgi:glucose/arabinose dehydrogenase
MHASRGSRAAALSVVLTVTSLLGLVWPRSAAAELPAGFSRVLVGSGLQQPTAFAFKNKKVFVTEKASGKVQVVRPDGSLRPTPYVTLSVSAQSERGLLGIALDPNFAVNQFVYVYYTTGPGALRYSGLPMNRVSRFTTVGGVGTSEAIILDNIPSDAGNHNGGDIQFGFDGLLYVTVGDGGQFHDDAQGLDTLRGKILRVNADGTIPADNPHRLDPGSRRCGRRKAVPDSPCREIYAYGLRNPFRMSLRQSNQSYIIADVGQGTWEELDVLVAGGNYGWNAVEGPCPFPSNPNCNPLTTPYPPQFQPPIHFYNHSGAGETGQTIIAGAFAESGTAYPAPYAGAYFYGDFSAGWVHVLTMDATNRVTGVLDFDVLANPVHFRNRSDGNVYVLSFGEGKLYKYVFTPSP